MVKEMEMINISTLPLTVTLALNYPFTLVCTEDTQTQKQTLVLQSGEIVKVITKYLRHYLVLSGELCYNLLLLTTSAVC